MSEAHPGRLEHRNSVGQAGTGVVALLVGETWKPAWITAAAA
jgi:hypothetical protein